MALPLAGFAAPAGQIEGKAARGVSPGAGLGGAGEQLADVGQEAHIGGRHRARGAADGAVIHFQDAVHLGPAGDAAAGAGRIVAVVELVGQVLVEHFLEQRGLAGPGDAGNPDQAPQGQVGPDAFEVVGRGPRSR